MIASAGKLPFKTKIAFGSGSLAFSLKDYGFNTLLMLYYNQVIGLPTAWIGITILLATLVDAVADPVIGQMSDHHVSRLGRRHPFMYAAALPVTIGYLLFWSPPDAAPIVQCAWLLVTSIIVRVGIALFEVPSMTLVAEFTSDYEERTSLSLWRSVFLAVGLVGSGVIAMKVFLAPTAEFPLGQLNPSGYVHYSIFAAVIMFVTILVATRGTQDRVPTLAQPKPRVEGENLLSNLKMLLADRAYVSMVLCIFFFAVAGGIITTLGLYANTYFWQLSASQIGSLAGVGGIGALIGLIASGTAKKLDKKHLTLFAYIIALAGSSILIPLQLSGVINLKGAAIMPYLSIQYIVVFASVTTAIVMSGSLLADVSDHLELKTSRRMEGLMFAALIMIQKGVSGFGVFLSGMILSLIAFPEKADPMTLDQGISNQLGLIYLVCIVVLIILALIALHFYPITRASHERTLEALRSIRESNA